MKPFLIYVFLYLFLSCGNDKIKDNAGNLISYRDSVFLEIEGNLNYPDTIWGAKDTWIKALGIGTSFEG